MSDCGEQLGYLGYIVQTTSPPAEFLAFVYAYSGLAFLLIYPFVLCGRLNNNNNNNNNTNTNTNNNSEKNLLDGLVGGLEDEIAAGKEVSIVDGDPEDPVDLTENVSETEESRSKSSRAVSDLPRSSNVSSSRGGGEKRRKEGSQIERGSSIPSRVHSAATTSKSYLGSAVGSSSVVSGVSSTILPNGSRSRGKNRKPLTNKVGLHRAVRRESRRLNNNNNNNNNNKTSSQVGSAATTSNNHRQTVRKGGGVHTTTTTTTSKRGISDLASSMLDAESENANDSSALFTRPDPPPAVNRRRHLQKRSSSSKSKTSQPWDSKSEAEISVMPSIVDSISPDEAADANDPGKVKDFHSSEYMLEGQEGWLVWMSWLDGLLDLAEPDQELFRILALSAPISIQSLIEAFLRLVMIGLISSRLGTDSMVAFVLVLFLIRLTCEEVGVAITDALSSVVQNILSSSGGGGSKDELFQQAGKYVQLALLMQLIAGIPLAYLLDYFMEEIVRLLVSSDDVATAVPCLARNYFDIVIGSFIVQGFCRTLVTPSQVRGNESIDSRIDLLAAIALVITSLLVLSIRTGSTLTDIAWLQLNIGVAASITKVAYVYVRGWLDPFWTGLTRTAAFLDFGAVCHLVFTSIPLFMGSFLEVGEVDLFTFLIPSLGRAEVAAWAILGVLWEALEAATEGMSEAAAIRVAYHLTEGQPSKAQKVVHKALFWSVVEAVLVTSVLLMAGRVIVIHLTTDPTLQHLLDTLLAYVGLANIPMVFAQISWSLVGAQGRFSLATVLVLACRWFVTIPLTLVCVLGFHYSLNSLACTIAVGAATASCSLSFFLLTSDWYDLTLMMQDYHHKDGEEEDYLDFDFDDDDDDDEDSDDSSFGIGCDDIKERAESSIPTTETVSGTTSQTGSGLMQSTGGTTTSSSALGSGFSQTS